jgi:hypothetical protein
LWCRFTTASGGPRFAATKAARGQLKTGRNASHVAGRQQSAGRAARRGYLIAWSKSVLSPLQCVTDAALTRILADVKYRASLSKAREAGHTFEEIAEAAGVTRSAIYQILNGRRGR